MGFLDVLNGMQNGPHGQPDPNAKSSGMSPITMAMLGLLAYKAVKSFTGGPNANPATPGQSVPPDRHASAGGGLSDLLKGGLGDIFSGQNNNPGGGAGDLLKGGLGGLLSGGAAGSVLSGGLSDLIKQFQNSGQGDVANSWIGKGPNKAISADDLASALTPDQIKTLTAQTGLTREQLLAGLSQHLPEAVNQLTPEGRVPTEHEVRRAL